MKALYTRVSIFLRGVVYSIKTIFAYLPILWHDADYDHMYFYKLMAFKLKRMEIRMEACSPEVVKDLRIARILCERLEKQAYIDWGWQDERKEIRSFKGVCEREEYLIQQDLNLLGTILYKHSRTWWD